jgi:hypothetical protein
MKKRNVTMSVAALVAALLLGASSGCEPEKNAQLVVRNDLGFDVAELSLTGDGDTGNLLGGQIIPKDADTFSVPQEVAPGNYTWHVVYSNAPKQSDQGSTEFELFPGPNNLVLALTPVF